MLFGGTKQVVSVGGMMCEHCAAHVEEALKKLPGVKRVKVDLGKKVAEISVKEPLEASVVEKAIVDAGYEFHGLQ